MTRRLAIAGPKGYLSRSTLANVNFRRDFDVHTSKNFESPLTYCDQPRVEVLSNDPSGSPTRKMLSFRASLHHAEDLDITTT